MKEQPKQFQGTSQESKQGSKEENQEASTQKGSKERGNKVSKQQGYTLGSMQEKYKEIGTNICKRSRNQQATRYAGRVGKKQQQARKAAELRKKSSKDLLKEVGMKYTKWTRNCSRKLLNNQKRKVPRNRATKYTRREGRTQGTNNRSSSELGKNVCKKERRGEQSWYARKVVIYQVKMYAK